MSTALANPDRSVMDEFGLWAIELALRPIQALIATPTLLFLAALTAMLTFPAGSRAAAGQIPQKSTFMRCSGRTSPGLPVP